MVRRFRFSSLRVQLGIAIVAVVALILGLTFFTVYRASRADLSHRIDGELRGQVAEWREFVHPSDFRSPAALERAARRFIAGQRFHPESRIFVVDVKGGHTVTNDAGIVDAEQEREGIATRQGRGGPDRASPEEAHEGRGDGLLDSPAGLATVTAEQAGRLRIETYPITHAGAAVGTLRIADPLSRIDQAESGLRRIFLIVGSLALVLALGVAALMAVLIARPLRRITAVAAEVDAGELGDRVSMDGHRGEVAALGRTFDRMLDRLQSAFARQRQFVSDASHELRTPLAVMHAQVELLRNEPDGEVRAQGVTTLLRQLDAMDRLVGDMLTLASAEGGRLLEPRWVDLDLFLQDIERDMPLFGDRRYEVERVPGSLYADPDRLTQVLRNLIRNAVSHTTAEDMIRLTVRPRGSRLELAVADTGPGIPEDQLEDIFERFHRADASRARDRGGSGLGLPIARALVEAHGGRIWAESPAGGGATIHVELPGYTSSVRPERAPSPLGAFP